MLCEICKKNVATTHIRSVINGVVKESHLCAECAAKQGVDTFTDNGLSGMLSSMFGDVMSLGSPSGGARCKCCGSTFSDIAETGKAGCPECYKTFYEEFLPYIKRVHGSVKHVGKIPGGSAEATAKEKGGNTLSDLKAELAKLVSEEKFEQAAQVRDKIREMEAQG